MQLIRSSRGMTGRGAGALRAPLPVRDDKLKYARLEFLGQLFLQDLIDLARVRLTTGLLHYLSNEESK